MRLCSFILATFLTLIGVGCMGLQTTKGPGPKGTGPIVKKDSTHFVKYLNSESSYLQSVRYDDVSISAKIPGQAVPRLSNSMVVCSKPNNFRMTAALAFGGGDQIDVGSNPKEMWMYVKMAKTPYVYCSQSDFPKVSEGLPVKFEPEWVMQALGMSRYDPNRNYEVTINNRDRTYQLSYADVTATGQNVVKVTEIAADQMSGFYPQVIKHSVLSADRKTVIAEARVTKVSEQIVGRDPTTKQPYVVKVPTELSLEWPKEKVQMVLHLGKITVNEKMTDEQFQNMFNKPRSIGNASPVNLAEYSSDARGVSGVR
jgi:hypothetical protein